MGQKENQQLKTQVAEKTGIIKVPFGSGIVGKVVDTRKGIDIADAYKDERFNQDVDIATGYRTVSVLCVPTTNSKGEVNGALQCINKLSPGIGELKKDGVTDPLKLYVPFTIGDSGNLISLGMKIGG